jgi:glycosyltransferase involved in cell wall biosynthesis
MQQSKPLISVVMTSYNHERYISQAIESILNQTFPDFELIIVDDASTDRSREIIEAYKKRDSRIRIVYHDSNKGISKTANDGFEIARGKFVALMNSDDLWTPGKLEKQICILQQNPDLVIWSNAMIIDAKGNETGRLFSQMQDIDKRQKSGYIFPQLVKGNFICATSIIFATQIVGQVKFDMRLTYAEDYKFMIDVARNHHFYFIPEPLVKYRIHGDNSVLKNKEVWQKDHFKIFKYVLGRYENDIPCSLMARLYCKIGRYILNRGHRRIGRRCILQAAIRNPLKIAYQKYYIRSFFRDTL